MAIKNTNTFHYKALKKYTQIGIFGVKIYVIWQSWSNIRRAAAAAAASSCQNLKRKFSVLDGLRCFGAKIIRILFLLLLKSGAQNHVRLFCSNWRIKLRLKRLRLLFGLFAANSASSEFHNF
jgi:hypothetical protein